MITITLGTIPYPFDRAIQWLEALMEQEVIAEPVFLQHGVTDISSIKHHQLLTAVPLLTGDELAQKISRSRFVISHAGQGSTRKLAAQNKSFVIIPRLAKYGEHIDNHQLLFSNGVKELGVTVCDTLENLELAIQHPPEALNKDLFSGPKLGDFLAQKYPSEVTYKSANQYAHQQS